MPQDLLGVVVAANLAWPLAAMLLGCVAGALANRIIDRLPVGEAVLVGEEFCGRCGRRARLLESMWILSRIVPSDGCRACWRERRSTAWFVEVGNAVLWGALALVHGRSVTALVLMAFVWAMLVLSTIDLHFYLLPDAITLPGIVLGVCLTALPQWPVTILDSTLSAGIGYFAMMLLARAAQFYYGEEALGQGDWKMVAMLGACLGAAKLMPVVLLANAAGAVVGLLLVTVLGRHGRQKLPLGTFLGAAGIVMAFV